MGGQCFVHLKGIIHQRACLYEVRAKLAQFMPYFLLKLLSCLYEKAGQLVCRDLSQKINWRICVWYKFCHRVLTLHRAPNQLSALYRMGMCQPWTGHIKGLPYSFTLTRFHQPAQQVEISFFVPFSPLVRECILDIISKERKRERKKKEKYQIVNQSQILFQK